MSAKTDGISIALSAPFAAASGGPCSSNRPLNYVGMPPSGHKRRKKKITGSCRRQDGNQTTLRQGFAIPLQHAMIQVISPYENGHHEIRGGRNR